MTKPIEQEQDPVFRSVMSYHRDSEFARLHRIQCNKENWDVYHLRQNWDHKEKGQSKEFLPKQTQAVEQLTSFLQQGLMDIGEWFRTELRPGVSKEKAIFTPKEVQALTKFQLDNNDFPTFISDWLKVGLLNATMICKIGGKLVDKPSYEVKTERRDAWNPLSPMKKTLQKVNKKAWQLKLSLVRVEDFYPDPTGDKLYEQEVIEMDYHELLALAEANPEEFNKSVIETLGDSRDNLQDNRKAKETDQSNPTKGSRKRIRFIEHWGKICDPDTGELLHDNVVTRWTLSGQCITSPKKNPLWHQSSPYVVSPILRVPFSVFHRALMDAPTQLNKALNEIFNLQFDGAMMSVFGVKQLREDWLENPGEVSDGIAPAQTLKVNAQCPPGMKVLERIDTGGLNNEAMAMYGVTDREFQSSAFSSDLRMGNLPQRQVKATEIVASNQAITGVFNGIVKVIETQGLEKILEKSWLMSAQHMNDMDSDEVKSILGEERANLLAMLSNEERFAATALGFKYKAFGLSTTLNKIQDFKKIATLLQTIGTSEVLLKEFMRKYSMTNLLGEILKTLDVDEEKLKPSKEELAQREQEAQQAQAMAMAEMQAGQKGKNQQSQIPQLNQMPEETGMEPGNPGNDMGLTG